MIELKEREKKIVTIGAVVAFVIMFYAFVVGPFLSHKRRIQEDIEKKLGLLTQYKAVSENIKLKGDKLSGFEVRQNELNTMLLSGNKTSIAAAQLQKILQEKARTFSIQVDSIRVSEAKKFTYFSQVPVEISVKSKVRQLKDFMYQLENDTKFLTITRLKTKVTDLKKPLEVETRMEVSGFMGNS